MLVLIIIIFPSKYKANPTTSNIIPNNSNRISASRGGKSSEFSIRGELQPRSSKYMPRAK